MKDKIYLYHYCNLTTAIKFILPSRQLRLGLLKNTNDPRENKSFVFGAASLKGAVSNSPDGIIEMNKQVSEKLREGCKVLCFSTDSDDLKGYQLSQMWAHYGERHASVCIAIDYEQFVAENKDKIDKDYLRPVQYVSPQELKKILIDKRYMQVDMDALKDNPDHYIKNVFRHECKDYLYFTKSIEWRYEQEARLIYFSDRDEDEFCSIRESLAMAFVGVDFDQNNFPALQQALGREIPIWPLFFTGEWLGVQKNLNE